MPGDSLANPNVVRRRFNTPNACERKHSPCFDKQPVTAGFCRQLKRVFSERNSMCCYFSAGLSGNEIRATNLIPDTIKCFLQIALWSHVAPSNFLNFSRQRARVGPMLATGIDSLAAISE